MQGFRTGVLLLFRRLDGLGLRWFLLVWGQLERLHVIRKRTARRNGNAKTWGLLLSFASAIIALGLGLVSVMMVALRSMHLKVLARRLDRLPLVVKQTRQPLRVKIVECLGVTRVMVMMMVMVIVVVMMVVTLEVLVTSPTMVHASRLRVAVIPWLWLAEVIMDMMMKMLLLLMLLGLAATLLRGRIVFAVSGRSYSDTSRLIEPLSAMATSLGLDSEEAN